MVLWLQGQAGAGDCWARVVAEREEGGHVLALVNVIGTWDESEEAQRWNLNFHCGGAATGGPMCGDEVEVSLAMSQALRAGSGDSPPQKHSVMAKRDSRPTSGEVPSAFLSTECCSVVLSDLASPPESGRDFWCPGLWSILLSKSTGEQGSRVLSRILGHTEECLGERTCPVTPHPLSR